MRSVRAEAAYLPSNIEYLARNNGLESGAEEALRLLVKSEYVGVFVLRPSLQLPIRNTHSACLCSWLLYGVPLPCSSESDHLKLIVISYELCMID